MYDHRPGTTSRPRIQNRLLALLAERGYIAYASLPRIKGSWAIRFKVVDNMTGLENWEFISPATSVADLWWLTELPKGAQQHVKN